MGGGPVPNLQAVRLFFHAFFSAALCRVFPQESVYFLMVISLGSHEHPELAVDEHDSDENEERHPLHGASFVMIGV